MNTNGTQIEHFGIDFGTTNIAVGGLLLDHDTQKAFRVLYGEDGVPFPSIVAVKDEVGGKPKVRFGRRVKTQIATMQDEGYKVFKSIKTALGEEIKYEIGSLRTTPSKVVSFLISSIKQYLEKNPKRPVKIDEATVAVPVDFTTKQREELCKAFEKAGIKVRKIVSESVAAYIRNRDAVKQFSRVVVFDWGGGTLDISLLEVKKGKVYEIATTGWKVAGDKIDETIAEFVHNKFLSTDQIKNKKSYDELSDRDKTKLLVQCEDAKIKFAEEEDIDYPANISILDYCGEEKVFYRLKYEDFEALISQIISDAVGQIGVVLDKADKTWQDLNAIIMVGGTSNLLPLRQIMEGEFFGKRKIKIIYPERPQWSVAEGAALIDCLDCRYELNQDIGIALSDGSFYPIIKRGSKIPFEGTSVKFGTIDNAKSANFIIVDDKANVLDRLTLPAKGFLGEYFEICGKIDNSLTARITIRASGTMSNVAPQTVDINRLSYYCDISEIENYQFSIIQ